MNRGVFAFAIFLAGCQSDDARIKSCEEIAQRIIKSPATYTRSSAALDGTIVVISFDSENGFGAMLRSQIVCAFSESGSLDLVNLNDVRVPKDLSGAKF